MLAYEKYVYFKSAFSKADWTVTATICIVTTLSLFLSGSLIFTIHIHKLFDRLFGGISNSIHA